MDTSCEFDVFISHNKCDRATVCRLGEELRKRGLRVWLDEWELPPGHQWLPALERIIATTKTAAVLVAKDGLGPWENQEMYGCLSQFVDRGLPVIPVLLPGARKRPKLPLFLTLHTWVDLRDGLSETGLGLLMWGITGKRPPDLAEQDSAPVTETNEAAQAPSGPFSGAAPADNVGGDVEAPNKTSEQLSTAIHLENLPRPPHRFNPNVVGQGKEYRNEADAGDPCVITIGAGIRWRYSSEDHPFHRHVSVKCHISTDTEPTVFQGDVARELDLQPVNPFLCPVDTFLEARAKLWCKHEVWLSLGPDYMPLEVWFPVEKGPHGLRWKTGFPRWNVLGMKGVLKHRMFCVTSEQVFVFERLPGDQTGR